MAGVRGSKNPFPTKSGKTNNVFSTNGPAKVLGSTHPHKDTRAHAHDHSSRSNGQSSNGKVESGAKRHQPAQKQW